MDWIDINTELFHFMRPQWLWLFVPMLLLTLLVWFGGKEKHKWKKSIAPHLLPYMVIKGSRFAILGPLMAFIVAVSLMIIATAGPTWKKVEVPGTKSEAILMIALDLSPSMLVEDVSPNRLERAKFKIQDLLKANPGSKVGLIAFSGTAHTVISPCTDYLLVSYQLQSLTPYIMPVQGTNYKHMLALADIVMSRTEAPSTLLLVTDNIEIEQTQLLLDYADNSNNRIEILAMASLQGGRIPGLSRGTYFKENGEFVISRLNQNELFRLQNHPKINVNPLSLGKEDVEALAKMVKKNLEYRSADTDSEEEWEENGFQLLWISFIILALWFRKGWMVQWCIVLVFFSSCNTQINSWDDLWYTKDYQGQQAMESQNYEKASADFESYSHKGVALYKAGDFEAAIEVFKQDTNALSMYNLSLAYAANGQNDLAMETLELAEGLSPNNAAIKRAKQNNQRLIAQMDSLAKMNLDSAITLKNKNDLGELKERKAASKDEELSADNEVKELPKAGNRVTDEEETGMRKADEMEAPPEDYQAQKAENAKNVLLREISADPSEFLKRRFKYQKKKYYSNEKQPQKLW
ncbi:VWA domain-containing protein [Carboxylicivirga sp. N1Y90]|uniref:VWA domain-containing protein n=1 Tax=Carboxylicivirga fragile TaxID=3417571 RepID=UPI003D3343FF|nr:VWA domain-containing protein [Marinilabiliaceae bacterium N1Y90]